MNFSLWGVIALVILAGTGRAHATPVEPCLLPVGIVRGSGARCTARIRLRREGSLIYGCLHRGAFQRWLAEESPRCWRPSDGEQGRNALRESRPPVLDREALAVQRTIALELSSLPPGGALDRALLFLLHRIERQRERFSRAVAGSDHSGWLRGWIVGEKVEARLGSIPAPLLFSLGFVHLLTTAGVHLLLLSRVLRRVAAVTLEAAGLSHPRVALALLGCAEWLVFIWAWMLSGMRWGMLRPLLLVAISRWVRRTGMTVRSPVPLIAAVGLEALLSLGEWGMTPDAEAASHGRWHYLAAVWGGAWGARALEMPGGMSVGSWLWVLPLQLFTDGSLSLMNPLLSAVTIPLAGLVLFPWALGVVVVPEAGPLLGRFSELLLGIWLPLAKLDWVNWVVDPVWLVPAIFASFCVYFVGGGRKWRFAVISACVACAVGVRLLLPAAPLQVTQLDVGQGDSALVTGPTRGLIDAGSQRAVREAAWLSMFSRQGVTRLDWVVLTHLDEDHAGGLRRIAPWVPIGCIVLPPALWSTARGQEFRQWAEGWGIRTQPRAEGCFPYRWAALENRSRGSNAGMAGVAIPLSGGGHYLNLGDAGTRGPSRETELLERLLPARPPGRLVLKLSHHGSRHSSAENVLRTLTPDEAWISAGYANPHGHPSPDVLERLQKAHIPWRGTWQQGGIKSNRNNDL